MTDLASLTASGDGLGPAVVKAVTPAAGLGTRFLPATKATPNTGDRLDYLKAVVRLASERSDLGPELRSWLREFVTELPAEAGREGR